MRARPMPPANAASPDALPRAALLVVALYAAMFIGGALSGRWLFDALGRPFQSDFVNVWAAGRMALEGHAAGAYDWTLHKTYETLAVAHDFDGYFGWHYPPFFFLVAVPLALLPYVAAHLAWMAATAPLYAASIRLILPKPGAALAALAFPAAAWNFGYGQNGFLTAALLGAGLALLERRPALAGVLFGLLAYKPQFGLLIPIALAAGGYWRTIWSAGATTLSLAAVCTLAFGAEIWPAFLESTRVTNHAVLVEGWAGFGELVTPFGTTRWLGGGVALAWAVQGSVAAVLAAIIWRVWRGRAPIGLKAALLAAASLTASPYGYVYDLVALAPAIGFLARRGLGERERIAVGIACLLIAGGPLTETPLAALAAPIVLGIALVRLFAIGGARDAAAT